MWNRAKREVFDSSDVGRLTWLREPVEDSSDRRYRASRNGEPITDFDLDFLQMLIAADCD